MTTTRKVNCKNARTSLMARSLVIGAALTIALTGGAAVMTTRYAMAAETPPAQGQVAVTWAPAGNAADAAKVAGLQTMGAPAEIVLGGNQYHNPSYVTAGSVAQATYEAPATKLVLRKAGSNHQAPMSDRAESEFAHRWSQNVDGINVALWGASEGRATVLTWAANGAEANGAEYCVTYQGLGGDEMSMSADEVANVVRAVRDANATQPAQSQQAQGQQVRPVQNANPTNNAEVPVAVESTTIDEATGVEAAVAEAQGTEQDATAETAHTVQDSGADAETDAEKEAEKEAAKRKAQQKAKQKAGHEDELNDEYDATESVQ